jgi:hypothetical protein
MITVELPEVLNVSWVDVPRQNYPGSLAIGRAVATFDVGDPLSFLWEVGQNDFHDVERTLVRELEMLVDGNHPSPDAGRRYISACLASRKALDGA